MGYPFRNHIEIPCVITYTCVKPIFLARFAAYGAAPHNASEQ